MTSTDSREFASFGPALGRLWSLIAISFNTPRDYLSFLGLETI